MKFRLTFKTNDVVDGSPADMTNEAYSETEREIASTLVDKYVKYGEYITIEFDTINQTATVVKI